MILNGKSLQQCQVNAVAPKGFIFCPSLVLYINDLSPNIICNISINDDSNDLYSEYEQALSMLHQLDLVSGLKSDFIDTVNWSRK